MLPNRRAHLAHLNPLPLSKFLIIASSRRLRRHLLHPGQPIIELAARIDLAPLRRSFTDTRLDRPISTGDFQEALAALLGQNAPNLSPAVISRLTAEWQGEYERWQKRDLSARRYVYVWADGVFLQARMEDHGECMLVLIGATPEGKKELIGFQVGVRESAQSWRELLVEVKSRGLTIAPEIAVGDGAHNPPPLVRPSNHAGASSQNVAATAAITHSAA